MFYSYIKPIGIAAVLGAMLSACGGASNSSTQIPTTEGLYLGTTNTNRTVTNFVTVGGDFYLFYSAVNDPTLIGGVIQGSNVLSSNVAYTSVAKDFNLEGSGVQVLTSTGSYVTAHSLDGTFTYPASQTMTFTSTYNAAGYQPNPNLITLAGTYTGHGGFINDRESATLTLTPSGAISGSMANGCTYTGLVAPYTRGNAYSMALLFGAAPCALPNATVGGLAYLDSANKRLYATVLPLARTNGFVFAGTSP